MNTSDSNTTGSKLAKIGVWLQLAPLIGLAGTVIGLARAFEVLGSSGVSDPSGLSDAIGHVLWWTAGGLAVGAVGMLLLCIVVIATPYRPTWLFWSMIVGGVVWTAALAPVGLLLLSIALIKRHEFFPEKLSLPTSPA